LVAANQAAPTDLDPVANKRAVELSQQLRCLVCQNQTIADSHAELAVDLKNQINEQIRAGRSDREIIDFMVQRYGDFVLYKPPFKAETVLLWVGPVALLVLGMGAYFLQLRRRRTRIDERPLSEAERREADRLLGLGKTEDSSK
jgi:cytochrome c-type biogenesis protein CcmH